MLHTQTMVIDADAHVLESERTWDYLEPADRKYRPVPITVPADPAIGRGRRDAWVIDGKIRGLRFPLLTAEELAALSAKLGRDMNTQQASREMGDVDLRIRHMDALGIHVQVLHNTAFIESVSDRPEVEVALCRAWNRLMTDPSFYPLFEEAERLDLPIASHIANAIPWMVDLFRAMYPGSSAVGAAFPVFLVPAVIATQALLISPIRELFPRLRWGIIEANAQWIPYVLNDVKERYLRRGEEMPQRILTAKNVYVACQNRDDVPYIISWAGDECLLIGTDYGHTDTSSDVDAIAQFRQRTDISEDSKHKIISDNPRRLYGLQPFP